MTDLHPQWHETPDDQAEPVPVHAAAVPMETPATRIPVNATVSRLPSALVGIFLTVLGGLVAMQGFGSFQSQVSDSSSGQSSIPASRVLHLAENTVKPHFVVLNPGETFEFVNETDIPQIIQSQTIKDGSGNLLYTPPIFTGSRYSVTVSASMAPGMYAFNSITNPSISGSLIVRTIPTTTQSSRGQEPFGGTSDIPLPGIGTESYTAENTNQPPINDTNTVAIADGNASSAADVNTTAPDERSSSSDIQSAASSSTSSKVKAISQDSLIPRNPYTVNGSKQHPFDSNGDIVAAANKNNNTSAPVPPSQPASGSEVWIVLLCSIVGFFLVARKSWRAWETAKR